jgi:aspartyl-tRNA(Asn)/glutamyl-tRNA(Gln) amidotransferase subunit A
VLTLTEQARAVANRDVSPVELVERALDEAERIQPVVNAFTHVLRDDAMRRAAAAESQDAAVPLRGVPIAVKDLYDVAGITTTGCCAAYDGRPPAADDSPVVAKLRAAGAIIVAKTNQHELACGATTLVSSIGPCLNPWDTARVVGGSSGGSGAAVASGVVAMAMGSDTGGSIRIPSSLCGNTGLKPTHGGVSLRGAMPMCPSLDTAGPLARSAGDCALVHSIIAGYDAEYLWSREGDALAAADSLAGLRLGIPRSYFELVHTETREGVEQAVKLFESLGMTIVEVEGPDISEAFGTFATRLAEVAHCYRDLWDNDRITPNLAAYIAVGRNLSAPDAFGGRELEIKVKRAFADAFDLADVLLAPTTVIPAPRIDDVQLEVEGGSIDVHQGGLARNTLPVNVAGLPAVAFPTGFSTAGTPLSAQLIGPEWSELRLCSIVSRYQAETDWHLRVAPVS